MSKKEFLSPEFADAQAAADAEIDAHMTEHNADDMPEPKGQETVTRQGKLDYGNGWSGGVWEGQTGYMKDGKWFPYKDDVLGDPLPKTTQKYDPPCSHPPQLVILDKNDKLEISFGKKWDCEEQLGEFDVAVNLTGISAARKHSIPIASLKKWESFSGGALEVLLDWPDYGVLKFPLAFWEELVAAIRAEGGRAVIFCQGGHGRTGTVMACLLITVLGFSAEEAKEWIWEHYCAKAIESKAQEAYIASIWKQYRKKHKLPERDKLQVLEEKK